MTFDGNLVLVDVVVVVAWVVDGVVDDQLAGTDVELTVDDWLISFQSKVKWRIWSLDKPQIESSLRKMT